MRQGLSRRAFGRSAVAVAGSFGILRHARGEQPLKLRCSLDTAPSHVRNVSIVDYLRKVEDATGGQVTSEVFHSGQLYADLNVAKALLQGQVDMAAPGDWTQTGIVPDADFCQLPAFYGHTIGVTERASDGKPGDLVARQLESKLRVKVLGPWLDLGFQNWYSTKKPLNTHRGRQGPEDPQPRRRRHKLAHRLLRRHPQHHGLAERAAGAVAGHLRRLHLHRTKAAPPPSCGKRACGIRTRTINTSPSISR